MPRGSSTRRREVRCRRFNAKALSGHLSRVEFSSHRAIDSRSHLPMSAEHSLFLIACGKSRARFSKYTRCPAEQFGFVARSQSIHCGTPTECPNFLPFANQRVDESWGIGQAVELNDSGNLSEKKRSRRRGNDCGAGISGSSSPYSV